MFADEASPEEGPDRHQDAFAPLADCVGIYRETHPGELGPNKQARPSLFKDWLRQELSDPEKPLLSVFEQHAEKVPGLSAWQLHEAFEENLDQIIDAAGVLISLKGVPSPVVHNVMVTFAVQDESHLHVLSANAYPLGSSPDAPKDSSTTYTMDEAVFALRFLFKAMESRITADASYEKPGVPPALSAAEADLIPHFLNEVESLVVSETESPHKAAFEKILFLIRDLFVTPPSLPPRVAPKPMPLEGPSDVKDDGYQAGGFV